MHLAQRMYREGARGATAAVDQASGKALAWHRDLGNCWQHILVSALSGAHQEFVANGKADKKYFDTLDMVGRMFRELYSKALSDNIEGIGVFRELYDFLQGQEEGSELYATFCTHFVQSFFCYMFTSRKLAICLPKDPMDERALSFTEALKVLSALDRDTRKSAVEQFRANGAWPTQIEYSGLLRELDSFLEAAAADKKRFEEELQERMAQKARREAAAKKEKSKAKLAKASRKKNRK